MKNELKDICNKLEGYNASGIPDFEVLEAKKIKTALGACLFRNQKKNG